MNRNFFQSVDPHCSKTINVASVKIRPAMVYVKYNHSPACASQPVNCTFLYKNIKESGHTWIIPGYEAHFQNPLLL